MNPGIPESNEYGSFFSGYVSFAQRVTDPVASLEAQMDEVLALLATLDTGKRSYRYAPDKWSMKQVVNHLTDAERMFAYRAMCVARNDRTPLPSFEPNGYVAGADADRLDWEAIVGEFEAVRNASIALFRNMPDAAWTRIGCASGGPISVRAAAFIMYGHVAHHLLIVRERYL